MRATTLVLALLVVATLLFVASCRQPAGDETAEAPPPEEHAHEHEHEAEEAAPSEDDLAPSTEEQAEAIESTVTDRTRFYSQDDMNTLTYIIRSGEPQERERALNILTDMLTTNENRDVRRNAAGSLTVAPNAAMEALIGAALNDKDLDVRLTALDTLSHADKTPELMAALEELRHGEDATVRMGAFRTLMSLQLASQDREEGLRWIAQQLGIRDDDVSAQAALALAQQDQSGLNVVPVCVEVLRSSPDADARSAAACVISMACAGANPSQQEFARMSKATRKEEVTPEVHEADLSGLAPLEQALANDPSPKVRAMAAQGLGYLGQASSAPLLAEALHDEDGDVRWWAATALITVPAQAAVSDLCQAAMDDGVSRVRRAAVRALGWVEPTPEVIAAMVDATRDANAEVRRAAASHLGQLARPDKLAALSDSEQQADAIRDQILAALAELLDDGDEDVRWAAVAAIGEMRDPDAAPILVQVVRDENPMVANAAERALQKMGIARRRFGTRGEG